MQNIQGSQHGIKRTSMRRVSIMLRNTLILLQQLFSLLAALELAYCISVSLGQWPVYRFISYVVLIILYSNIASATARSTTKQHKTSIYEMKRHAQLRTTAFLAALR